jgi:hypothetical protein
VTAELVFIQFEQPALFEPNFLKMRSLDGKSSWEVYMGSLHGKSAWEVYIGSLHVKSIWEVCTLLGDSCYYQIWRVKNLLDTEPEF